MKKQHRIAAGIRVALCLAAALNAVAKDAPRRIHPKQTWYHVNVQTTGPINIDPSFFREAQDSASAVFKGIHVDLTWEGEPPSAPDQPPPCAVQPATPNLALEVIPHAPPGISNVALAMAMPYTNSGVRIVLFHDRVDQTLSNHPAKARVLGYILAHEVAHVLQGISRHSDVGITRAGWSENDFHQMAIGALSFTNEDVQLIRHRLDATAVCSE